MKDGPYALRRFIEDSQSYPIEGLYAPSVFHDKIWELYDGRNLERPVSTGWPVLDQFYRVVPGELTVVTGVHVLPVLTRMALSIPVRFMVSQLANGWFGMSLCQCDRRRQAVCGCRLLEASIAEAERMCVGSHNRVNGQHYNVGALMNTLTTVPCNQPASATRSHVHHSCSCNTATIRALHPCHIVTSTQHLRKRIFVGLE